MSKKKGNVLEATAMVVAALLAEGHALDVLERVAGLGGASGESPSGLPPSRRVRLARA